MIRVGINYNEEMLSIYNSDKYIFYGNFWDFNKPDDIINLLIGIGVEFEEYELEDIG